MSFENWFGKSKVTTPEGAPLLVFHGTRNYFSEFRTPAWFTPRYDLADICFSAELGEKTPDSKVIPVYLSFQNPFYTDDWGVTEGRAYEKEWVDSILAQGYDSIIFDLDEDGDREIEYIALKPEQIMMANHALAPDSQFKNVDAMRCTDDVRPKSSKLRP